MSRNKQVTRAKYAVIFLKKQADPRVATATKLREWIQKREPGEIHGCLLLAVFGMYVNGYIRDTPMEHRQPQDRDYRGFDGTDSENIHHAFDAYDLLEENRDLEPKDLKEKLGGENSVYQFVCGFFASRLFVDKKVGKKDGRVSEWEWSD